MLLAALRLAATLVRVYRLVASAAICECDVVLETDFVVDLYNPKTGEERECAIRVLERLGEMRVCITPVTRYELRRAGIETEIPVCRRRSVHGAILKWLRAVFARHITNPNTMRDLLSLYTVPESARFIVTSDRAQCRRAAKFGLRCIRYKGKGVCP